MLNQRITVSLIVAQLIGIANAQVPPCTNYHGDFSYGSIDDDAVQKAIGTSDGNVVMVGHVGRLHGGNVSTTRYGGAFDALVLKVAPDGSILWSKTFGGNWIEDLMWVTELPGGDLLAAGYTQSTTGTVAPPVGPIGNDGWYMRLDADGNELWNKRFRAGPADVHFSDGALTTDGAILLDGNHGPGIRIDLSGNVLLTSSTFVGERITASVDGTFLIAHTVEGPSTGLFAGEPAPLSSYIDIGLVNVNADATVNWVHRLVAPSSDYCTSLLSLPDGFAILSSSVGDLGGDRLDPLLDPSNRHAWIIRTDIAGEIIWERSTGGGGIDDSKRISLDTDGGILMAGAAYGTAFGDVTEPWPASASPDGWIFKLDASGNKLWDKRWGGSDTDIFTDVIPVPSGYLLVGNSGSNRSGDHHDPGFMLRDQNIWMVQMYPGLPGQWYPDTDADGFGDACCPLSSCAQPTSYVSNPWDCEDFDFPNFPDEYLGAPCNDGDWHTIADQLAPACVCTGTFVDPADLTPVTFTLWPDIDPGQTTWELREITTNSLVMSGGPYPNGSSGNPESGTEWIPPVCSQRYQLFVYDGAANGMVGGRYTLSVGDDRLIDSDGSFQQVSSLSSALLPIDLPVGDIDLISTSCDRLDLLANSVITCDQDQQVSARYVLNEGNTGYQFWIFDPHGSYSRRIFQSHKNPGKGGGVGAAKCANLKLGSINTLPVPQFMLLNVRVRSCVSGIYGTFGPACTMKVDPIAAACPTTRLMDSPNDPHPSCGVTYPLNGSQRIWAYGRTGVNKYQFEFDDQQTSFVRSIASATPTVLMTIWGTSPLTPLHSYDVRVRCSKDGGATWCAWGPACTIQTSGSGQRFATASTQDGGAVIRVFPNPASASFRVRLDGTGNMTGTAELSLFDITGREVLHRSIDVGALADHAFELPIALGDGTYLLRVGTTVGAFSLPLLIDRN